jgi:hypothetical protein
MELDEAIVLSLNDVGTKAMTRFEIIESFETQFRFDF